MLKATNSCFFFFENLQVTLIRPDQHPEENAEIAVRKVRQLFSPFLVSNWVAIPLTNFDEVRALAEY